MSDGSKLRKNDVLNQVRLELKTCPKCGQPFDQVDANSHQSTPDPATQRIYFLFTHGKKECVDYTTGGGFDAWLAAAKSR